MSSNNALKQYFIKVLDPDKPKLSETTVCCTKCHQHGIIKRFDPKKENLQSDHLFEFHAIIYNQPSEYILGTDLLESPHDSDTGEEIQYNDEDVVEVEFVQQPIDGGEIIQTIDQSPIVRHSGVWNYFEEQPVEQKVYCLLCRQADVVHSYSTNSSTSNLRKHLRTAHEVEVQNYRPVIKKDKNDERRGYGISRVWKYFCKVRKNGEVQERDYVYCIECLKSGVQHRYKQTSSTGTLKAHLRSVHQLHIDSGREYNDDSNAMELENYETIISEGIEATPIRKGKNKKLSNARAYYEDAKDDEDYVQCIQCLTENKVHKYRKSTSSSTMRAHLVQKHNIDPDTDEPENSNTVEVGELIDTTTMHTETLVNFDQQIIDRAQKVVNIKTRKIRTYFIRLDDEDGSCCAFCIIEGIKKSYKSTTSTSGLRRHLISSHQLDPLGYFKAEDSIEVDLNAEQLAESIGGTNKQKESEVWKYFCRKEIAKDDTTVTLDEDYVYCSLCWNAPVRQIHKYKNTTSSGALKRHLAARHGRIIAKKRKTGADKLAAMQKGQNEDTEIYVEEVEELPEMMSPEKQTIVRSASSPQVPAPIQKIKVQKYCRSCSKKDAGFFTKLSAIFDDSESDENSEQITLADLYNQVTGIQVKPDDGMSQLICYMCEANLKSAYKFRKIALETETEMIRNLFVEQNEMDEYEEFDEEYLEVEPATANMKREIILNDSETTFQSPISLPKKANKPTIITVIPNYSETRQGKDEMVICRYDNSGNQEEIDEYEQENTFEEYDIIEDDLVQYRLKRRKDEVEEALDENEEVDHEYEKSDQNKKRQRVLES